MKEFAGRFVWPQKETSRGGYYFIHKSLKNKLKDEFFWFVLYFFSPGWMGYKSTRVESSDVENKLVLHSKCGKKHLSSAHKTHGEQL